MKDRNVKDRNVTRQNARLAVRLERAGYVPVVADGRVTGGVDPHTIVHFEQLDGSIRIVVMRGTTPYYLTTEDALPEFLTRLNRFYENYELRFQHPHQKADMTEAGEAAAQQAYAAYNAGGAPETANLNYAGLPCPAWADLPENVKAKWLAAVRTLFF